MLHREGLLDICICPRPGAVAADVRAAPRQLLRPLCGVVDREVRILAVPGVDLGEREVNLS